MRLLSRLRWTLIKIAKLDELNEFSHKDEKLTINPNSSAVNVAFGLGRNAKTLELPEENCNISWDRLTDLYVPHTSSSLL